MRKKENDVKRGGWSAHKLADESGYAIDTKQKLKQGDVDEDDAQVTRRDVPPTSSSETTGASPQKQSARRRRVR
jgi:hypothetical protein